MALEVFIEAFSKTMGILFGMAGVATALAIWCAFVLFIIFGYQWLAALVKETWLEVKEEEKKED